MFFRRRKHKREQVTDCLIEGYSQEGAFDGKVVDLSDGGMKVNLAEVPDMTSPLTVYMTCASGRDIKKNAVVAWFVENMPPETGVLVGLKFI